MSMSQISQWHLVSSMCSQYWWVSPMSRPFHPFAVVHDPQVKGPHKQLVLKARQQVGRIHPTKRLPPSKSAVQSIFEPAHVHRFRNPRSPRGVRAVTQTPRQTLTAAFGCGSATRWEPGFPIVYSCICFPLDLSFFRFQFPMEGKVSPLQQGNFDICAVKT